MKKVSKDNDKEKVDVVLGYLSEISVLMAITKIVIEYLWYIIVIFIPIIMFVICIMAR